MFDTKNEKDMLTFAEVKKVFDRFTTDNKLKEMMHPFTTQGNESLNMRVAELAPKFKNYSRTKSLDYRVEMAIGHHNAGMYSFYSRIFEQLDVTMSTNLACSLRDRDSYKMWKKDYNADPNNKRRRRFKWQAKDRDALLRDATEDPKVGNYETDAAMKATDGRKDDECEGRSVPKKRKLTPCQCGGKMQHFYRSSKYCLFGKNANDGKKNHIDSNS